MRQLVFLGLPVVGPVFRSVVSVRRRNERAVVRGTGDPRPVYTPFSLPVFLGPASVFIITPLYVSS